MREIKNNLQIITPNSAQSQSLAFGTLPVLTAFSFSGEKPHENAFQITNFKFEMSLWHPMTCKLK
jgi:hypothetical protein